MREHRFTVEMPHSAARIWALMQDYPRWTYFAPMVVRVEVLHPGDARGDGLLRRVIYRMPLGRAGAALELVTNVEPERGYTYTMIGRTPATTRPAACASSRSARPDAPALRGALPPGERAVEVVRGVDLPLHQRQERGVDAGSLGLALGASRVRLAVVMVPRAAR